MSDVIDLNDVKDEEERDEGSITEFHPDEVEECEVLDFVPPKEKNVGRPKPDSLFIESLLRGLGAFLKATGQSILDSSPKE